MEAPAGAESGFKDAIVTLPTWGIASVAAICAGTALFLGWLAVHVEESDIKAAAVHVLGVLVPLASAVIAAMALRFGGTRPIDRLVTHFLEHNIKERFTVWTEAAKQLDDDGVFPFREVRLVGPSHGRSYAYYELAKGPSRITVGIKANVFNFEVIATLPVVLPTGAAPAAFIINSRNVETVPGHPLLGPFVSVVQGSVAEGYEVAFEFNLDGEHPAGHCTMQVSLRQKLRENFLASPFLRRYFAEDAAIAIGVLYREWRESGFAPPASA